MSRNTVLIHCRKCKEYHEAPFGLELWICPGCGKNLTRRYKMASRSMQEAILHEEKRNRIREEKKNAVKEEKRAFEEKHRDKSQALIDAAKKLLAESGFTYNYVIPWTYPAVDQVYVFIVDSVARMPFEESGGGMDWETCSLRRWLNNDFFQALPCQVKQHVVKHRHTAESHRGVLSTGEIALSDKIFLPSKEDGASKLYSYVRYDELCSTWTCDEFVRPSMAYTMTMIDKRPKTDALSVRPSFVLQL